MNDQKRRITTFDNNFKMIRDFSMNRPADGNWTIAPLNREMYCRESNGDKTAGRTVYFSVAKRGRFSKVREFSNLSDNHLCERITHEMFAQGLMEPATIK